MKTMDFQHRESNDAIELQNVADKHKHEVDIYSMVLLIAKNTFLFITSLKIELITFLYMAAYVMRSNTAVAILMDRACRVHLNYSDSICDHLDQKIYETQKKEVEKMANNYHMGHTMISLIPSSILSCFIGPWSDRYSRRIPMIAGLVGIILDGLSSTTWAYFSQARAEFYFIPPLFSGISGGFIAVITVIYSYASDTTLAKQRTIKYALLEAALGFSMPTGTLMGGKLYKYYGAMPVFGTSCIIHSITLVFVCIFLKETKGIGNKDNWKEKIRVFFSSSNFLEGFKVAAKVRPHRGRLQLWMLVLAMGLSLLVMAGSAGTAFLFVYHHFNWDNDKFSTVSSVFAVMTLVVMMVSVPIFTKVLHLGDPMLGIIGSASSLAKQICTALAAHEGVFYLGCLLNLFSGTAALAGRARISKIIPKEDLGKVFAFLTTVEAVLPIGAAAATSQLFNATIGIIPDPTYMLFSASVAVMLAIFIWTYFLPKVNYEEMREEEDRLEFSGKSDAKEMSSPM